MFSVKVVMFLEMLSYGCFRPNEKDAFHGEKCSGVVFSLSVHEKMLPVTNTDWRRNGVLNTEYGTC